MTNDKWLVTGASGQLGRQVVELLLDRGASRLVATTRSPASLSALQARGVDVRAADFEDSASLRTAFQGVQRALLISTDAIDRPGHRIEQHRRALAALIEAGVEHIVYTSLTRATDSRVSIAADHARTEALLAESRVGYTALRNNVYTDLQLFSLPGAVAGGALVHARGERGIAYVTRADVARTAAAALERASGREILEVTGPSAVTGAELAAIASRLTGKPVANRAISVADLKAGMLAGGLPPGLTELYASFDDSAAHGELEQVTDVVQRLTGRAPTSVEAFLSAHRAALG